MQQIFQKFEELKKVKTFPQDWTGSNASSATMSDLQVNQLESFSMPRLFKGPCLSKLLLVCKSFNLIDLRHGNEKRTKNGPLPEEN